MLPPITKSTPKKLYIPKEIYASLKTNERNGFWFISWLGRSYYIGDKIYREFYITLCDNTFYHSEAIKTLCLEFPEEYSLSYKQGNFYLYNGTFYNSAYKSDKTLLIKNAHLTRNLNSFILDIRDLLSTTYYPLFTPTVSNPEYIDPYKEVPLYLVNIDDKKYIIPLNIIQSYFYAISSLSIYYLIYDILPEGLGPKYSNHDTHTISFRSSVIQEQEAYFFSKFYFLSNGKFESLYKIHQAFKKNLMNKKKNKKILKTYIIYEFPFIPDTDLLLDLHYQPIDQKGKINMVYAINNVHLASGNPNFYTTDFFLNDIDTYLKDDSVNKSENLTSTKITNIKDSDFSIISTAKVNNPGIIENIPLHQDFPTFSDSPLVSKALPEIIKEHPKFANQYINHVNKYDSDISHYYHSRTSNTGIANLSLTTPHKINYIDIILKTFKLIKNNNRFDSQYIFLYRQKNSLFSYDPYDSSLNGSILLFRISYHGNFYCIVVRQNTSHRIGIIKRFKKGDFDTEGNDDLKSGFCYIFKKYQKYDWSELKIIKDPLILKFGFQVVNSLNKTQGETMEDSVNSLYIRITNFIIAQEDHTTNNQ